MRVPFATLALLGVTPCVAGEDAVRPVRPEFRITSEYGAEADWVPDYLRRAARVLVRMYDAPDVAPPAVIEVELKKDPANQGLGGWATPTKIGFSSSSWPDEPWRHWILVHELVNLFTAHYGAAGGHPSDWWANGRSPFPMYVACLALANLGLLEDAVWLRGLAREKPDHQLYWALHKRFGFELFADCLKHLRADGIDLGRIGAPWPNADALRSRYTIAYLSLVAGENLAATVRAHGIGTKPSDWDAIHPDKPFREYEVKADEVEQLLAARKALFEGPAAKDPKLEPRRQRFRLGAS
jgi:hypothetical protein